VTGHRGAAAAPATPRPPAPPPQPAARRAGGGRWQAAFFVVAAVAIVAGLAWALLGSSLLVVRSIQVTGIHLVSRAQVLRAAEVQLGTPLIRVDTAAVARRVQQITQVQSARVVRDWPDTLVIAVRERTPALAVARGGRFELIDRFGVVVRQVTRRPRRMPLLVVAPGSALRGSPAVRAAATVLAELPPSVRRTVRTVTAPSAGAVTLGLRGRITVVWGGAGRGAAKAAELRILMHAGARYYNVSDPGTAVTAG
jgi:cell division protein FtsQ